ncbi:DUF6318 family protein [Nocardioides jensenii]|uniref:DUF6318 family protein n=1 Tax=Nocardioides jensenii TaxID=1843 RepID=UPI000AF52489|nr:DUF6318 family protein [Nocardioides jensenii]
MRLLRRLIIGLTCASLLTFAGCSDDDDPSADPSETPSLTSSPSESASTYTPPSAAKPPKGGWPEDKPATEISAEKVARLWIKALSSATVTGDTSRLRAMTTPKCEQCAEFAGYIESDFREGIVVRPRGAAYVPKTLTLADPKSANHVEIRMLVRSSGGTRKESSSGAPSKYPAQTNEWFFVLRLVRGRWKINDLGLMG